MHPPQDATYNGTRRSLRFQLARSSKNDWEHCKIIKCKEMEKAIIVANFTDGLRTLFHAKPRISQVLKESEDTLIHSQYRRLGLWAEHFRARFNCPTAKMDLPAMLPSEKMRVDTSPPSEAETVGEIGFLRMQKVAGPDGLSPAFFKNGEVLTLGSI